MVAKVITRDVANTIEKTKIGQRGPWLDFTNTEHPDNTFASRETFNEKIKQSMVFFPFS